MLCTGSTLLGTDSSALRRSRAALRGAYGVASLMALVTVGCAHVDPAPISPAARADALESRSLDDARLHEFIGAALASDRAATQSAAAWNLTTLTLAALYYRPDLDGARAQLSAARARAVTAAQIPNPTLAAGLSYNATTTVPSPWTIGGAVNFLIETLGHRSYRTAQAQDLVEAARFDLTTVAWQVRSRVRTRLAALWAAEGRLALSERRLALQERLDGFIERRRAAGEASGLDVARERVARSRFAIAVTDAERERADAKAQLAAALGVPLHALDSARISCDAFANVALPRGDASNGEIRRAALTSRSDVQSVLKQYDAAQSALQLEVARQYPNVVLGPGYTYDQGDNKYVLSLALDLPLFNQNQGGIAEANARRGEVAAKLTSLQSDIMSAVDAAEASYRASTAALEKAEALVDDEVGQQRRMSRSFAAGEVDRPTLVATDLAVVAAELSRFEALVKQRDAIGLLEDALQHPFFEAPVPFPDLTREPRLAADRSHE